MLNRLTRCIALVLLTASVSPAQTFTQTRHEPPVKLSYDDVVSMLQRVEQLIKTSNSSYSQPFSKPAQSLTVGNGDDELSLSSDISLSSLQSAPSIAYEIDYDYVYDAGAPVSRIAIYLDDYQRRIAVSGSSQAAVDAITDLVVNDLSEHASTCSGPFARTCIGVAFVTLASLFIPIVFVPLFKTLRDQILVIVVAILVMNIVLWAPPWNHWLAGTAVYKGDPSFLARHSAEISFWGLVLAAIPLVIWLVDKLRKANQGEQVAASAKPHKRNSRETP